MQALGQELEQHFKLEKKQKKKVFQGAPWYLCERATGSKRPWLFLVGQEILSYRVLLEKFLFNICGISLLFSTLFFFGQQSQKWAETCRLIKNHSLPSTALREQVSNMEPGTSSSFLFSLMTFAFIPKSSHSDIHSLRSHSGCIFLLSLYLIPDVTFVLSLLLSSFYLSFFEQCYSPCWYYDYAFKTWQ